MASGRKRSVFLLLIVLQCVALQGAKILTICLLGGSHYLLMDEITRTLHNNGHEVRMFKQTGEGTLPGYKAPQSPYPVSTFTLDEKYLKAYRDQFMEDQKEFFMGRLGIQAIFKLLFQMSRQCNVTLYQTDIFDFLKREQFDIAMIEVINPCALLVCEKLGLPYIALYPGTFANAAQIGMPTPLSSTPMFATQLTDQMDFFERLKNTFMYFASFMFYKKLDSIFDGVIEEHFPVDSRPNIPDLQLKAQLWLYNTDFTLDFARPLLPHVQYIGGLMAKPAKPLSQELEDFIAESGDLGFIVVTLGSMISSLPTIEFLKEMNSGFAKVPQKVIWRYQRSKWPEEVEMAPNVKLMDWLSQNDLLGHPRARLLVTHGGVNSLMEAVYHGVPVMGIPLFGDQHENMVRVKAKNMGTFIPPEHLKAENFAAAIREVIENKSYKESAMKLRAIRRSQPFPPDQNLVRWVEHIIHSGGGGHLHPSYYHQPWYQQYLLDVIAFLLTCLALIIYLTVTLVRFLFHKLRSPRKHKQS